MKDFSKIYEKFKACAISRELIAKDDAVIAAVSGGRDSVAMLLLLLKLADERKGLSLYVFHFNHCLRGEASDGDEAFVKDIGEKNGLKVITGRGDAALYAKENRISIETAARDLRYTSIRKAAEEIARETSKNVKIAVAHTVEDRAETIFLNIARGTSVEGLEGIKYANGNVIRPILDLTKEDVETVCGYFGEAYRTDLTNFERIGRRNVVRLDVFPYIDENLQCDIKERLISLSKLAAEDADFLDSAAESAAGSVVSVNDGEALIEREGLSGLHPAIRSRVLRKAVSRVKNACGDIAFKDCVSLEYVTVKRAEDFILRGGSGELELGKGIYCVKRGDKYAFTGTPRDETIDIDPVSVVVPLPEKGRTVSVPAGEGNASLLVRRVEKDGPEGILKSVCANENAAVFDGKILENALRDGKKLLLRNPESGDCFRPFGTGGKPLRKYLTDRKIPAGERKKLLVLAIGSDVIHVFNVKRSDFAKITENTEYGAVFEIIKG